MSDEELKSACRFASVSDTVPSPEILHEVSKRVHNPDIDHREALELALAVNVRTVEDRHYFTDAITGHSTLALLDRLDDQVRTPNEIRERMGLHAVEGLG
jgi:hypothetical protein